MILPALNRSEVYRKGRKDHAGADHDHERDASRPEWHGWRVFRRGLTTNLHPWASNSDYAQTRERDDCYRHLGETARADSKAAMKLVNALGARRLRPGHSLRVKLVV